MTDYPYEPPRREYADTLLAFKDFQMAGAWSARVEPDPLGDINRIVTLMRGDRRIKSVLCPVPIGATVQLVRDEGGYSIDDLFALKDLQWRTEYGQKVATGHIPVRQPGWRIEVNGDTVLTVTDAEMTPPPTPAPKIPWRTRMRQALREQLRSDADWIAKQFGYHRDDDCGGDW